MIGIVHATRQYISHHIPCRAVSHAIVYQVHFYIVLHGSTWILTCRSGEMLCVICTVQIDPTPETRARSCRLYGSVQTYLSGILYHVHATGSRSYRSALNLPSERSRSRSVSLSDLVIFCTTVSLSTSAALVVVLHQAYLWCSHDTCVGVLQQF